MQTRCPRFAERASPRQRGPSCRTASPAASSRGLAQTNGKHRQWDGRCASASLRRRGRRSASRARPSATRNAVRAPLDHRSARNAALCSSSQRLFVALLRWMRRLHGSCVALRPGVRRSPHLLRASRPGPVHTATLRPEPGVALRSPTPSREGIEDRGSLALRGCWSTALLFSSLFLTKTPFQFRTPHLKSPGD